MDPDYLRRLALLLEQQADELANLRDTLHGQHTQLSWSGPAAEAFARNVRSRTEVCAARQRDLRAAAEAMRVHADAVAVRHASEQPAGAPGIGARPAVGAPAAAGPAGVAR
jgi:hypothetical protein